MKLKVLSLAAMIITLAVSASAAVDLQFVAGGSSAMWLQFGQAVNDCGGTCTGPIHIWTKNASNIVADDTLRSALIPNETGRIWVAWDSSTPNVKAWAYIQLDSAVGVRLVMAKPRARLIIPAAYDNSAPDNILHNTFSTITETNLDAAVRAALNTATFNVGMTDIRPEDAKFATDRLFADCGSTVDANYPYIKGLGYASATPNIGTDIKSFYTSAVFHVINFSLPGNGDPFDATQIVDAVQVSSVGAAPIVIVVNKNQTGAGHFGNAAVKNVNRWILAGYQDGTFHKTTDLLAQDYAAGGPEAIALVREGLSGTYNTMEYGIPDSAAIQSSQDANNCSGVVVNQNPLGNPSGSRKRVIGTGQMQTELAAVDDSIGYTFWSFGNLTISNTKYLTLDGVDPIRDSYVDGSAPTLDGSGNCVNPCPTLSHVSDGTYPAWSILRAVTDNASPAPGLAQLITDAQNHLSTRPDFVGLSSLKVFRSHFTLESVTGDNGNGAGGTCDSTEAGGDVGGAVYTKQADGDYCADNPSVTTGITGKRQ